MASKSPKQVIIVRSDLNMPRGKEAAQVAHASMAFIAKRLQKVAEGELGTMKLELVLNPIETEWLYNSRSTKICLSVPSEAALDEIYFKAQVANVEAHLIVDSGLTVFHGVSTKTCLAIGPDWSDRIDPITQGLKLR